LVVILWPTCFAVLWPTCFADLWEMSTLGSFPCPRPSHSTVLHAVRFSTTYCAAFLERVMVCSVTDGYFFIFIPGSAKMFGSGRKSKAQRDVDRVSKAVWMTLKYITILEEAEEEDSEKEFYTPPCSPSERIAWHADQSQVIRFGGECLHTPARAAQLFDLHNKIYDQMMPNQISDGGIQVISPPKPPMTLARYKL
jgi:hypothetical protein